MEAEHLNYAWDEEPVIRDFSTTILRGDRIGVIGPNGCGKSTLLNLLLGRLQPDSGRVRLGTNLEIAYFDQMRAVQVFGRQMTYATRYGMGDMNQTAQPRSAKHTRKQTLNYTV